MYFESSSYQSGSLGQFYDNSWPKTSGDGTSLNPYVLAHTTSSQATNWFSKAITSSSLYDNENNNKLSGILPEFINGYCISFKIGYIIGIKKTFHKLIQKVFLRG